jgi:hypothetical protein
MSAIPTSPESSAQGPKQQPVEVSLERTDPEGNSETATLEIESGPTKVPELKTELGVEETASLWVIEANGKKKQLGDHESHNVKAGDRYQALVRGGVS